MQTQEHARVVPEHTVAAVFQLSVGWFFVGVLGVRSILAAVTGSRVRCCQLASGIVRLGVRQRVFFLAFKQQEQQQALVRVRCSLAVAAGVCRH